MQIQLPKLSERDRERHELVSIDTNLARDCSLVLLPAAAQLSILFDRCGSARLYRLVLHSTSWRMQFRGASHPITRTRFQFVRSHHYLKPRIFSDFASLHNSITS